MVSNVLCSVDVLFWQGRSSAEINAGGLYINKYSPGHVALHIHHPNGTKNYISFWPPSCPWQDCPQGQNSHRHTEDEDLLAEKMPPEKVTLLLDANKIKKTFEGFDDKARLYTWTLWGSSILRQSYERNCAGLVLHLLKKGGLEEIVSVKDSSSRSRRVAATCVGLSIVFFGGFFAARPLLSSLQKIIHIVSSFDSATYSFSSLRTKSLVGLENFGKMRVQCESIRNVLLEQNKTFDTMANQIESYHTIIGSAVPQILQSLVEPGKTLTTNQTLITRQVMVATSSFLLPAFCTALVLIVQKSLFLSTTTPKDVMQLAKKAQRLQQTQP